jgi:hypothetical protein
MRNIKIARLGQENQSELHNKGDYRDTSQREQDLPRVDTKHGYIFLILFLPRSKNSIPHPKNAVGILLIIRLP